MILLDFDQQLDDTNAGLFIFSDPEHYLLNSGRRTVEVLKNTNRLTCVFWISL